MAFLGIVCAVDKTIRIMPGTRLLWAGAISNLVDRAMHCYVVDWIYADIFSAYFNLADIWLCLGLLLALKRFRE
jgi:lipoprotein signal peptidase